MGDLTRQPIRPFVVYWNNIPSPYMVERFNALTARDSMEFEAWFNDRTEHGRSWAVDEASWHFRYRYLPTTNLFGRRQHWPLPLFGRRPDLLVSLYAEPSFVCGWILAKLRGAKTGFRVLMTHDRWVHRHPIKNAVKRLLFRCVDAVETPGDDGKQFAQRCGARPERIHFATHTIDLPYLEARLATVRPQRQKYRKALGIRGTAFLYVGRLWWGKGLSHLLDAFETVQRQCTHPVTLLLVGDGEDEIKLRQQCEDKAIANVIFCGFKQKSELPLYYAVADAFVFPTLGDPYGIVVNEAMACSLPIVSTSSAGEIRDRVQDGYNGFIVPPADSASLSARMMQLAENPALREIMGRNSRDKVQHCTPEEWASDFERIVQATLSTSA